MRNLTLALGEQLAGFRSADLPGPARRASQRAFLDALGVMLAASGASEEVRPFVAAAGDAGGGPCSVLGTGLRTTAPLAALANGAMAHALDFEDVFDPVPCHPNASSTPAGLAMAQHIGDVRFDEFITALALACEVVCRAGLGLRRPLEESGWYPPTVLGSLGAAIMVARLLQCDANQVAAVLSLQMMQYAAPGAIMHDATSTARATREAFPAQAAVSAGLLVSNGARGFADPLGGPGGFFQLFAGDAYDENALLETPRDSFHIEALSFKRWPSCRGTHGPIEAALQLAHENDLSPGQIDSVEVRISELQRMLAEPAPRKQSPATAIDAKFSIPFTVAAALVHGKVSLDEFSPAGLADAAVLGLGRKITCRVEASRGRDMAAAGSVEIRLVDGGRCGAEVTSPTGSPQSPASDRELVEKFVGCCGKAEQPVPEDRAARLAAMILDPATDVGIDELLALT